MRHVINRWSEDEILKLVANSSLPMKELMKLFPDRSYASIELKRRRLGLFYTNKCTRKDLELIVDYYKKHGSKYRKNDIILEKHSQEFISLALICINIEYNNEYKDFGNTSLLCRKIMAEKLPDYGKRNPEYLEKKT